MGKLNFYSSKEIFFLSSQDKNCIQQLKLPKKDFNIENRKKKPGLFFQLLSYLYFQPYFYFHQQSRNPDDYQGED